ncbi:MAG: bifunctional prepilin peptidase / N-methyltransferase PilD [Oceanicaulis sp. HLUCCA04]|nr:MAG: bifunctional prepilin peptidase / N-methyltransferase PilD [Oceanicaulis sp. HLUCCA04]
MISPEALLSSAVLLTGLSVLTFIDIRTFRLPDWMTLPLIPAGWLAAGWLGDPVVWHVAGAAIGYGAFVALELVYKAVRGRDGLGRGDAKLLAVGGAWCGALLLPVIVLAASMTGLIWVLAQQAITGRTMTPQSAIAFGPFLAASIVLGWLLLRFGLWA